LLALEADADAADPVEAQIQAKMEVLTTADHKKEIVGQLPEWISDTGFGFSVLTVSAAVQHADWKLVDAIYESSISPAEFLGGEEDRQGALTRSEEYASAAHLPAYATAAPTAWVLPALPALPAEDVSVNLTDMLSHWPDRKSGYHTGTCSDAALEPAKAYSHVCAGNGNKYNCNEQTTSPTVVETQLDVRAAFTASSATLLNAVHTADKPLLAVGQAPLDRNVDWSANGNEDSATCYQSKYVPENWWEITSKTDEPGLEMDAIRLYHTGNAGLRYRLEAHG